MNAPENIAVSVIVPVFNGAATLERCLAALAAQDRHDFELIVVDNGSTDGSAAMAENWRYRMPVPLHVLHEAKRGVGAARNRGAHGAVGRLLAFTDADCEPLPDWIDTGLRLAGLHQAQLMAGPAWGTLEGGAAARLLGLTSLSVGCEAYVVDAPDDTGGSGFAAANLWLARSLFERLGGFDEALTVSGEDVDLCVRAYRTGVRGYFLPQLRVQHIHSPGTVAMCRKMVSYGRAHALLFERHGRPGIYLDLPLLGRQRLSASFRFWCNMASAEKKALLILALAAWQPWLLLLMPLYLYRTGSALCRRATTLGDVRCGSGEAMRLASLMVVKSAALTWGRLCGSRWGTWTC